MSTWAISLTRSSRCCSKYDFSAGRPFVAPEAAGRELVDILKKVNVRGTSNVMVHLERRFPLSLCPVQLSVGG